MSATSSHTNSHTHTHSDTERIVLAYVHIINNLCISIFNPTRRNLIKLLRKTNRNRYIQCGEEGDEDEILFILKQ